MKTAMVVGLVLVLAGITLFVLQASGVFVERAGIDIAGVSALYPRDEPPPRFEYITSFKGALVGLRGRALHQSIPGRPESWPQIFVVEKFFFDTKDELVAAVPLQEYLIVGSVER